MDGGKEKEKPMNLITGTYALIDHTELAIFTRDGSTETRLVHVVHRTIAGGDEVCVYELGTFPDRDHALDQAEILSPKRKRGVCGAVFTSGGHDPYSTECDQTPGHDQGPNATMHEGPDEFGTPGHRVRWSGGGMCAGDPLPYTRVVRVEIGGAYADALNRWTADRMPCGTCGCTDHFCMADCDCCASHAAEDNRQP